MPTLFTSSTSLQHCRCDYLMGRPILLYGLIKTDQNHCEFSIDVTFQVRKRLKRWYQSNLKLLKFKFCTGEEWNLLATSTVHTEFLVVTVRFSLATTTKVEMRANLGWSLVVSIKISWKLSFLFLKNCFAIQSSWQQSIAHFLVNSILFKKNLANSEL